MAIAEFINFTSIPVKVTINEYLEISKEFSTPKSNSFINGILDKILYELKAGNIIKKVGRGLIEE
jgi:N utilization substance protein B